MNRVEFMTELAILLQNIPAEERREAMQYYSDYFDDAGAENEAKILEELGSPEKIAEEVKAGLKSNNDEVHEYRETGYTDTRFESKEMPAEYNADSGTENAESERHNAGAGTYNSENDGEDQYASGKYYYCGEENPDKKVPTDAGKIFKIVLIILAAIIAIPIVVPVVAGVASALIGILIAAFAVFLVLVVASAAVAISGVSLFVAGLATLLGHFASGLVLAGMGMILTVLGIIATVASVRLCFLVWPAMFKGIVWVCRKLFQRRKAVA